MATGTVFDIQRFCLHDGPGLRTAVFLKGCPLRCRWCSNPESQSFGPELLYAEDRCMGCGACAAACPRVLITPRPEGGVAIRREACDACGACEDVCPRGALFRKGRIMSVESVMAVVERDRPFYQSDGGVTVSGGEPFAQAEFLHALLLACKEAGLSTAVETTAIASRADIERCLPLADHMLIDLKHPTPAAYEQWTGADISAGWKDIGANIGTVFSSHAGARLRIPVIPGCNTDSDAAEGFAAFIAGLGKPEVELLPYHTFGESKYRMLGRPYPGEAIPVEEAFDAAERLQKFLQGRGIHAVLHG